MFTEQFPKGVGPTEPRWPGLAGDVSVYEKIHFNAAAETEFLALLPPASWQEIVVTGTEARVFVLQTSLELRYHGYPVRLSIDATGSRTGLDKEVLRSQMRLMALPPRYALRGPDQAHRISAT